MLIRIIYNNIPKILDAISMYEEQVIRQSFETKEREINLFDFNYEIKKQLVLEKYRDIVCYLLDNTKDSLVWGKLSDFQKKKFISSILVIMI